MKFLNHQTKNNTLSFALFLPYIKTVFKCTKLCGNEIGMNLTVWVIYADVITYQVKPTGEV